MSRLTKLEPVKPIERLGVSKAPSLLSAKSCLLQGALGGRPNYQASLLPGESKAFLGSVIHKLYENAILLDPAEFYDGWSESEFDRLVIEKESVLSNEPMNAHLAPLSDIPNFRVSRESAIVRGNELAQEESPTPPSKKRMKVTSSIPRRKGPEVWVQDSSGTIGGWIDLVKEINGKIILYDHKTGSIFEESSGGGYSLKKRYELQLQLYAALYDEFCGTFPKQAFVRQDTKDPMDIEVELDIEECKEHLARMADTVKEINQGIAASKNQTDLVQNLAKPDVETCRFCPYRPGCEPYLEKVPDWMVSEDGHYDVVGKLIEKHELSTIGTWDLLLKSKEVEWIVEGVTLDEGRNEGVALSNPGDTIGVFNGFKKSLAKVPVFYAYKRNHAAVIIRHP